MNCNIEHAQQKNKNGSDPAHHIIIASTAEIVKYWWSHAVS